MTTPAAEILHVDLDAFYVSVERSRSPELARVPVVVGGAGQRGVVLSCSYETRARGVRNGMPAARARRLCPQAVFVPPDFKAYTRASRRFRELLDMFTPRVEPLSLDEAFCDVSGAHRMYGSSEEISHAMRARIREELGLVCSVGGGPSKLVAKVASRMCKPDGVLIVEEAVPFLHPLPVEQLWGVGDVTAAALRRMGITTVGELAAAPDAVLRECVGEASTRHLRAVAWGIDTSPVLERAGAKSVGAEETFEEDVDDEDTLSVELLELSDRVAARLVQAGVRARTVTVKIRLADFATHTRSVTADDPTSDTWTVFKRARKAYGTFRRGRRSVRLLGVTASGLVAGPVPEQLSLEPGPAYAQAEDALTAVRSRFGRSSLSFARLLGGQKRPPAS